MKGIRILSLLFFFPIASFAQGSEVQQHLDSARSAYDQGNYRTAKELYEKVTETHISPSLHYNIGNAAFRSGDLGEAILHYRRARKRAPWDPDIAKNLEIAVQETRDDFENESTPGISGGFKDLLVAAPLGDWWTLSLILSILCGSSFFLIGRNGKGRSFGMAIAILFLLLTLLAYGADIGKERILASERNAVVLTPSIEVRNSPKSGASTAFVLHEGTSVKIRSMDDGWVRIGTPDEQVGWVERDALGLY